MGTKAWALLSAAAVGLLLLGCAAGSGRPQPAPVSSDPARSAESSASAAGTRILGHRLPTSVAALEAELGRPTRIQRPAADDPSPWGQWLEWKQADGSTLRALADDYSSKTTDSHAEVRFLELRANPEPDSRGEEVAPFGFTLGGSFINDVFDGLPGSRPSMMHARGELGAGDLYRATILYQRDGLYTYFFFDDAGELVGVAQATFPADAAD